MRIRVLILSLLIIPAVAASQISGSFSGPSLGFVFDDTARSVRPLFGITGSTTVGAPIDVGSPLTSGIALPDGRNILASPVDSSVLLIIDMKASPALGRPIAGTTKPAEIALSLNGQAAALAYPESHRVQIVTGMPAQPVVSRDVSTADVQGILQRAVVNDAGNLLLMSFQQDEHEAIYRWSTAEGFRPVASAVRVGALGFVNSTDAVYADRVTNEVFFAQDVGNGFATQFVAGPDDGVSQPVAIAPSRAGGFFLANHTARTVMTFDANRRMVQSQECSCEVSGLFPLSPGVFRMTQSLRQTIYLLDDTKSQALLVFVPPIP